MIYAGTARLRMGRLLVAALVFLTQALILVVGVLSPGTALAAPGSPGTPQNPTSLFAEGFEGNPIGTPLLVTSYVGTGGMTYAADPPWLTACNGNVVAFVMTARPANCAAGPQGMSNLRSLAYALGVQGGATDPTTNRALSAYTDLGNDTAVNPGAGLVQLQTAQPIAVAPHTGRRYVTASVDIAAVTCQNNPPLMQFTLLSDGLPVPVTGQINACTDPRGRDVTVPISGGGSRTVHIGTYSAAGSISFTGSTLGVRVVNNQASGFGNDAAMDNIKILDATPQLDKSFSPATQVAGQPAQVTFTITNTSELASKLGWSFTDALPAGMTVVSPAATTTCTNGVVTAPAGSTSVRVTGDLQTNQVSCTATVNVTAAAGHYVNGPGNISPDGVNPPGSSAIDFVPVLTLAKSGVANDLNGNGRIDAGETISYSFTVTNPVSNGVTLSTVAVTDPKVGPVSCPVTILAPGQSTTCTATYTVTQADVDAGAVNNTATATATSPAGVQNPASVTSSATVTIPQVPAITLVKSVTPTSVTAAGDQVTYRFDVTNTGNVPLTGVAVTETAFSGTGTRPVVTCPDTSLAPGQSTTCTATYTVTQADVNAGTVTDTATVSGTPASGPAVASPPSSAALTIPAAPAITLVKTVSPASVGAAGQQVTYRFDVTNTGNVPLTGVVVTETAFSGTGTPPVATCQATTLAPGASTVCTATYTVTQADVNAGTVTNSATVSGTPPSGPAVTSPPSNAELTIPPAPSITLVKTVSPASVGAAGQQVTYRFDVTNTGNVPLTGVVVTETAFSGTGTPPVATCQATSLAPGASTVCTATYTVTQADVNAGTVTNTATVSGTPPSGPAVTSPPSGAQVTIPAAPAINLVKTVSPTSVGAAGDQVTYRFDVTNTGNVPLTGVVVTETAFSGTGTPPVATCQATTLAPGDSTICTATYTVTQADVNAGTVTNTATVSGTPPSGPAVTSPPSSAEMVIPAGPAITLVKTVTPASVTAAGQQVTYRFDVTNIGNVPLTGVAVTETAFSGTGTPPVATCQATTLAPGDSTTCTATYTVTQADVNAGGVTNVATVSGTPPSGPAVTSPPSGAQVTIPVAPSVVVVKTVTPTSVTAAGDQVTYRFDVTNTGNVPLTGVAVTETAFSGTGTPPVATCQATTLAPGASTTCTATYTVTQADVNAGTVTNSATVSGTPPSGPAVTSPPSNAELTIPAAPSVVVVKSVSPTSVTAAGDQVTYRFDVTNTGNVPLTGVAVTDSKLGPVSCTATTLAPGASTVCTATYTVTQADVNAGTVTNSATVSGTPPSGPAVTSPPSNAELTIPAAPSVVVVKSVSPTSVTAAGDQVTYRFDVTNTGNVPLTGVAVTDSKLGPVSCTATTLAPGDSTTCTATYTVTQADVNAGTVTNSATVSGTPPSGPAVTSPPSNAELTIPAAPSLVVVKSVTPTSVTAAGDQVTYRFDVTNTGNVPLTGVAVTETAFSGTGTPPVATCQATTLAPGDSTTCTATYTVTQADMDAGGVINTATASGTPPSGPAVTSPPANAELTVDAVSATTLTKTAGQPVDSNGSGRIDAGDTIAYSFEVTNTGNVTLTDIMISDEKAGPVSCPATPLAPGESTTCATTYTITQADVDAATVANTATATATPPPTAPPPNEPTASTTTGISASPAISLVKTAEPTTFAAGDTITYTLTATNTGNVTLADVKIMEVSFSGTGTLSPLLCNRTVTTTLAPGQSFSCDATYQATQADVDAGTISNAAVATGTPPTGPDATSSANLHIAAIPVPPTPVPPTPVPPTPVALPETGPPLVPLWIAALLLLTTGTSLIAVEGVTRRRHG